MPADVAQREDAVDSRLLVLVHLHTTAAVENGSGSTSHAEPGTHLQQSCCEEAHTHTLMKPRLSISTPAADRLRLSELGVLPIAHSRQSYPCRAALDIRGECGHIIPRHAAPLRRVCFASCSRQTKDGYVRLLKLALNCAQQARHTSSFLIWPSTSAVIVRVPSWSFSTLLTWVRRAAQVA